MKSINATKAQQPKLKKMISPSFSSLTKAIVNAVPVPMSIKDLLDEAIEDCEDELSKKQEQLDGLKSLKVLFKNVKPGSKEEKALLSMLRGF